MEKNLLDRINYLARESRERDLTEEEKKEQQQLRQEYIGAYRKNMRATLDTIVIVDPEGNRKALRKDNVIPSEDI